MEIFIQQVVSGLATGGIYASLALALVMIYQATDVVNFAQGEMAMFATYLCWTMLNAGVPVLGAPSSPRWSIAFVGGVVIERVVIRPVENAPILTIVIVTLGLLVICNSVAGWIWTYVQKPFPSPFPSKPLAAGNVVFGAHDLGQIARHPGRAPLHLPLLPLHAARARHARGRAEPGVEPAGAGSAWAGCSRSAGGWPPSSARWRA